MTLVAAAGLVERLWVRQASLWTGRDEGGWLDEPERMLGRVSELETSAAAACDDRLAEAVLLGMGGSSLAPEMLRRTFGAETFHALDTTHPAAHAALREQFGGHAVRREP